MAWTAQVNGHVQVFYVSGSKIKVRPAIITGIVAGQTVNVRVGHKGGPQTFASLPRRVTPTAQLYPCYIPM